MATRGRKPKPTALKLLEGNPGKRPLNANEPIPPQGEVKCPSWLLPEAKKEWKRLAPAMESMGILTLADEKAFAGYQINAELMALTNPGCMVQHCLPAHRGEEITADVFEAHADEIFDEAENRLHAQKAVMYLLMGQK